MLDVSPISKYICQSTWPYFEKDMQKFPAWLFHDIFSIHLFVYERVCVLNSVQEFSKKTPQ
jgi:hypothetical protein